MITSRLPISRHEDADLERDHPADEEHGEGGSETGVLRGGRVVDPRVLERGEQEGVGDEGHDEREDEDPRPPHRPAHQSPYRPGDQDRIDHDRDGDEQSVHSLTLGAGPARQAGSGKGSRSGTGRRDRETGPGPGRAVRRHRGRGGPTTVDGRRISNSTSLDGVSVPSQAGLPLTMWPGVGCDDWWPAYS